MLHVLGHLLGQWFPTLPGPGTDVQTTTSPWFGKVKVTEVYLGGGMRYSLSRPL